MINIDNNTKSLKKLALAAKKRLNGAANEEKKIKINRSKKLSFEVYKNLYNDYYKIVKLDKSFDDELYIKILNLLKDDIDIINPISKLIDYEKYNSLSNFDKERYVMKISDKYVLFREQIITQIS